MDFAKKQLEKYGWREGQGLGKYETGISSCIKPKLKFDNAGIGHNPAEEFQNDWWNNVYNQAASNIDVSVTSEKVQVKLVSDESIDISTKGNIKSLKKLNKHLEYGSFIKRSTLTEDGVINESKTCNMPEFNNFKSYMLSDEQLFAACEGRTAHKGARHGLKQSGKLSRIERQEKMLLKKLQKVSLTDEDNVNKKNLEKKLKKINDHKDKKVLEPDQKNNVKNKNYLVISPSKLKKNRKEHRKRVSFNETVTEYKIQEQDLSPQSGMSDGSPSTVMVNARLQDENQEIDNEQDEGIDCPELDPKNYDSNSDEFNASVHKELSKKERKILRRKLKRQNEKNSKTSVFLSMLADNEKVNETEENLDLECQKCYKRKLKFDSNEDDEDMINKKNHSEKRSRKNKNKKLKRREKRLEKRLNNVVDSLHTCKISDSE